MKLNITLRQLEQLLHEQKINVIEKLINGTAYYNTKNTPGSFYTIENIDKEKFKETGMQAPYPDDYKTLKRFLIDDK